ncbi:MAG: hypothetical protein EYC68_07835 [Chloroflexota bacterium]|nr:MAG: hypothetical protein EYC68_07835 [Chloroflexota bacterium]
MNRLCLLFALCALLLISACVPEPITPIYVIEYPATWTPGPTATITPHPPTATLVIQRTAGPAPTRDPNVRRLPGAPRGSMGVWLDIGSVQQESIPLLAPRAQIFVETEKSDTPRASGNFLLLRVDGSNENPLPEGLLSRYDGVYVENVPSNQLAPLREKIAPRLVITETSLQDKDAAAALNENADGICFCNFLRDADAPIETYKKEDDWQRDIETLAELSAEPDAVILTATRFPEDAAKNFEGMQQWLDYAAASFLLGVNNSHTFFGFQGKAAQEFLGAPAIVAKIGTPLGAMFKANGVYQRRFSDGLVVVNPTDEARAFALSRNYLSVNGTPLSQLELPPHTGMILLSVK